MSQTKKFKISILFILLFVSFFAFGCKNETPVEDISFNIDSGNQIVLIVGQELRMDDYVTIYPSYATNKGYSLISFNESLVKVENNSLIALKEGNALIKVVSKDNALKEDMMTVIVKSHQEQLKAPLNLKYDSENQIVSFDPVMYASSYTLKINGQVVELGNSTSYNLSQYNCEIFDSLLIMQVKANAPAYSFALTTSEYSSEKKIYQAGAVKDLRIEGGVLKFNKFTSGNIHDVYLNNTVIAIGLQESYLALNNIDEIYVGQTINCKVNAVVSDEIKQRHGADVMYYNSNQKVVALNVLDVPSLRISASRISWQNISHSSGYSIFVDGEQVAKVQQNHFDLKSLENFDTLITSEQVHNVEVYPIVGAESVGVAQTNKKSTIKVQRLNAPTAYCEGTDLKWNEVENVSVYAISLIGNNVELISSTAINTISMANYAAGDYEFEIVAVSNDGANEDGVYFLSSKASKKNFAKHEIISLNISNYILNLANLGEDRCEVLFDDDTTNYNYKISDKKIDLYNEVFAAGEHSIKVKRLSDEDHIESDENSISFIQLEKIENIRVAASIATVTRSAINKNAKIYLVTTGAQIEEIRIEQTSYAYNSENKNLENYLPAGDDYITRVYVEGDGSSTFAYRENGEVVSCCEARFEVLSAPSNFEVDKTDAVLTFESLSDKYNIFKNHNAVPINVITNRYPFSLESGSVVFQVRSMGNGSTTLSSELSEEVNISRLERPTLSYNNTNNYISKTDTNDENTVAGYLFTHNGEVVSGYKFGEEAFALSNSIEGNEFTLTVLAIDGSDNNFYLNSKTYSLSLSQINNASNISLSGLTNNLIIAPQGHREQYNLVVEFTLNDGTQTKVVEFKTKVDSQTGTKVLSNGLEGAEEIVLPYTYSGRYVIQLIDENYNAIIEEANYEFSVRVRYVKESTGNDLLINSEYSESTTLNLTRIAAETIISVNTSNQMVITPIEHNQQFGFTAVVMISETTGFVAFTNGEGKIICSKMISISNGEETISDLPVAVELSYTYRGGAYYINLLDEEYNCVIPGLNDNFSVRVKYSFAHNGIQTDLDSEYCETKTILIQEESELSREDQKIKIKNIKDTYTYQNYSLLVNNYPVALDARAINENGFIVVDVETLYGKVPANKLSDVNVVEVITKNNETSAESPLLAIKGGTIKIAKTQTITLNNNKYNNNEDTLKNNSTFVYFNTYETTYNKKYTIEIYNNGQKVCSTDYSDSDANQEGVILFYLDEIEELVSVSGMLEIVGFVSTNGANAEVEMFNSDNSNRLNINKILVPANLSVSNNTLRFSMSSNAVGYEVYEKTGVGYTKLSNQLLTDTYFNLTELTGVKQLVVKAISKTGNFTNSSYSEVVTINKVASPTVAVVNGKININFPFAMMGLIANPDVNIDVQISNGASNRVSLDLDNLEGRELKFVGLTTLQAEPYLFMSYNNASLASEKLTLSINLTQNGAIDGVYYVSPEDVSVDCYGLFAPTNVKKTTNENDSVEIISWTANSKNVLQSQDLSVGYVFRMEYSDGLNDYVFYSDDANLKYFDEETNSYVSYPSVINGTSTIFPAGYGLNEDGSLTIPFGPGIYRLAVQAVPLSTIAGYNLCNSKFSSKCQFEIMNASVLGVEQGKVVWNAQPYADHYVVSIYEQGGSSPVFVDNNVRTTEFDFANKNLDKFTGVYKVVVKAISTREDTLNSADSEPLYVYRIPEAQKAEIDDGRLIISATAFFEEIEVELFDIETNITYVLPTFRNVNLEANLQNLKVNGESIVNWAEFTDVNIINSATKFSIDLNGDVLNILDGRDYSINIKLIGNSNSDLGIISTVKTTTLSNMKATKLKPSVIDVDLGAIKFTPDNNYATISQDGVYTSLIQPHYVFNGATSSDFWNMTTVYKIVLSTGSGVHTIYAVDYYSLTTAIANGNIQESEYELLEGEYGLYAWVKYPYVVGGTQKTLYFHVFENNEINFRNYDSVVHYSMLESVVNGENYFSCSNESTKISLIGTIVVDIYMLGGDSFEKDSEILGYLSAKSNDLSPFECYENNVLTSFEGQVQFNDLTPVVNGVAIDYPLYKLEVSLLNTQTEDVVRTFYVYHTSEEDAMKIARRHDPVGYADATYIQTVINEDGNIVFDLSSYYPAGTYKVAIKTLAGLGNGSVDADDYLINSRGNATQIYQKLSDSNFYIEDGVLNFKQSYIVNDGKNIYYNDYEITLVDNATQSVYVYNINLGSEGVSVNEGTAIISYVLPAKLHLDEGLVTFDGGKQYEIKVRAIAKDNLILNGTYKQENDADVSLKFEKSLGISEVNSFKLRIEDGMLKWKVLDLENYVETVINIAFLDENKQTKIIEFKVQDLTRYEVDGEYQYHYHQFTDGKYNYISSGGTEIKDLITYVGESNPTKIVYAITAYTKGKVAGERNIVNSNVSSVVTATRLSPVNTASIKTVDGVLTWEAVPTAVSYKVNLNGSNNYEFVVDTTSINFLEEGNEILPGTYEIQIKVNGSASISSMVSNPKATGFEQLKKVELESIKIQDNKIVWNAVQNASAYKVEFEYTNLLGNFTQIERIVNVTEFTAPNDIQGLFSIAISAVSVGEAKQFNSAATVFTSSSDAPIQVANFEFDNLKNRFVIDVTEEDFLSGDKLLLMYNFTEYVADGEKETTLITKTITYKQNGIYEKIDDNRYRYYYPISVIGKYANISVQVSRPGTVPSNALVVNDIDFNLFDYGAGIEGNPYIITSAQHLLNIEYFTSAHYLLKSSIYMNEVNIEERIQQYGAIICDEFTGVLDGASVDNFNFSIYGFNMDAVDKTDTISLTGADSFALFKTLNNATVKNLTIGSENIQLILVNTFAKLTTNMIKLSVIATGANNSTIDNVDILNMKFVLNSANNATISKELYIGGLVAIATGGAITNSYVNISSEINISCTTNTYIGGAVAQASLTNVSNSNVSLNLVSKVDNLFSYVGGCVAYYEGNDAKTVGIVNTNSSISIANIKAMYLGGLVGYARGINVQECTTSGTYSRANINHVTYIGGLIGMAQNSIINKSGSDMEINITVSSVSNKYIGAIVGSIEGSTSNYSTIKDCYMTTEYYEKTEVTTSTIKLGIYGSKNSSVTITSCYKKEN